MRRTILALTCGVLAGFSGQRYDPHDLESFPVIPEIHTSLQARLRRALVSGSLCANQMRRHWNARCATAAPQ